MLKLDDLKPEHIISLRQFSDSAGNPMVFVETDTTAEADLAVSYWYQGTIKDFIAKYQEAAIKQSRKRRPMKKARRKTKAVPIKERPTNEN